MRWWWHEPFDYDWLHGYVQSPPWLRIDLILTASGYTLFTALGATLLVLTSPTPLAVVGASTATGVFAVIAAWWWMTPTWPTQQSSLLMVAASEIGVAALLVASPSWPAALALTSLYVLPGMYLVFVHSPQALAVHHMWVIGAITTTGFYVHTDSHADPATTVTLVMVQLFVCCGGLTASHLALTVQRRGARDALTDPLTGLLNRRGFFQATTHLLAEHPATPFVTVTIIDVDKFKPYNDFHGHQEGDRALREIATMLERAYTQHPGVVARIGGDEFLAITHLDPLSTGILAQHILDAATHIDTPTPLTVSIGTHTRLLHADPNHTTIDALIAHADRALYEAKQAGGNTAITAH